MDYKKLKVRLEDGVAILTLNDPGTLNALGMDVAEELSDALKRIGGGIIAARAVVLTGEGRGFCSGANLSGGTGARAVDVDGKPDSGKSLQTIYNPLVTLIRDLNVPIITAVNGVAAGIGCSLALLGDIIVAAESSYFLQAFRRIGLVPDGGSTYILPRMIGRARAMEMTLRGEKIPSATALEWGMVNRVVPDAELMSTALGFAKELAAGPKSLSLIRGLMWDSLDRDWTGQLDAERRAQAQASKTEDYAEGVGAFLEKRPAVFKGK